MTPKERLDVAERLLERSGGALVGLWPRACAVLVRQALEGAVDRVLREEVPGSQAANWRVKFLCLGRAIGDERKARELAYVWGRLSEVLHRGGGAMGASEVQLRGWVERVRGVVEPVVSRG